MRNRRDPVYASAEDEYLATVRQGAITREGALSQLTDEYTSAEASLNRIMHVLDAIGERDYAGDICLLLDKLSQHEGWTLAENAAEMVALTQAKRVKQMERKAKAHEVKMAARGFVTPSARDKERMAQKRKSLGL